MNKVIAVERARRGMSKQDFAMAIGVSLKTAIGYENNPESMRGETISKVCRLFNCTADYLLGMEVKEA